MAAAGQIGKRRCVCATPPLLVLLTAVGLMAAEASDAPEAPDVPYDLFSTARTMDLSQPRPQQTVKSAEPVMSEAVPAQVSDEIIGLSSRLSLIRQPQAAEGGGDLCDQDATLITTLPYHDTGNTCDFTNDYNVSCDFPATGPDVVYRFEADYPATVDILLCGDPRDPESGSDFDTTLFVYKHMDVDNECTSAPVACNEDFCAMLGQPNLTYVSALHGVEFEFGATYYIVIDGYEGECGNYTLDVMPHIEVPTCDEGAFVGQSPASPAGDWDAPVSDADYEEGGVRVYERIGEVVGAVDVVRWWGIETRYDEELAAWVPCDRRNARFEISFHADDPNTPGQPQLAPLHSYEVWARWRRVREGPWYLMYGDYNLVEYEAWLWTPPDADARWISIQGIDSGAEGCQFLWMGSEDGDGRCYQQRGADPPVLIGTDVSFCLESLYPRCTLECPVGAIPENEVCGEDANGGCNRLDPAFTPIALGPMQEITVCGTQWAEGWWRDTDWYAVEVIETTQLTMAVTAEIPVVFGFVNTEPCGSTDCEDMIGYINPGLWSMPCIDPPRSVTQCVPPGTYWLFVGPGRYSGYPCRENGDNEYLMTVRSDVCALASGACCQFDGTCALTTECQCEGFYAGDDVPCEEAECPDVPTNDYCATAEIIEELPAVVVADTRLATDDIGAPCGLWFGPYQNVWYQVTGTGNVMTASTCSLETEVWDTTMSVFCAGCEEPLCVAGNDDAPGCEQALQSTVSWCSREGAVYYITIGSFYLWTEPGLIELTVTDEGPACTDEVGCPTAQPNDECRSAQRIPNVPASIEVDTRLATDDEVAACGDVTEMYQNVWYEVIGTGGTMTVSTCNEGTTVEDTAISVFCTSCEEGICVAGNNDSDTCGPGTLSSVSWCSEEGMVYYVTVGSGTSETEAGAIHLDVTSDEVPCVPDVECSEPVVPGPVLLRGESLRSHGASGMYQLNLPVSGPAVIEPRQNGQWAQMILRFDQDIEAEDGAFECGDEVVVTNGDCFAIEVTSSKSIAVRMDFDRNACVRVAIHGVRAADEGSPLEGDNDLEVLCHEGDVNRDGDVNVIDLQAIKNRIFQVTTIKNFLYDVDVSGGILNVIDLQETKNNLFSRVTCP